MRNILRYLHKISSFYLDPEFQLSFQKNIIVKNCPSPDGHFLAFFAGLPKMFVVFPKVNQPIHRRYRGSSGNFDGDLNAFG